jgi:hypothetical protein
MQTEQVVDSKIAPICLFAWKRVNETQETIKHLQANHLASESELFIFVDGPKKPADEQEIKKVVDLVQTISGFKKVTLQVSAINKGLSQSIIGGVTEILQRFGKVIVLEDDLLTSPNFLSYMNNALDYYKEHGKVFSVSGHSFHIRFPKGYSFDHYFSVRGSSWGWATWIDRWETVDWKVSDYKQFISSGEKKRSFNKGGSDLSGMLRKQMEGKINSWAIRWCYQQWKNNQLTVYPRISKIKNIGFGAGATHTSSKTADHEIQLDDGNNIEFHFSNNVQIDQKIAAEFARSFSINTRIKNKLLGYITQ